MIKFELNEVEEKSANDWMDKQKKKKKTPKSTSGGRFCYKFTITSVGDGITIIDNLLNEEKDITDYDCW